MRQAALIVSMMLAWTILLLLSPLASLRSTSGAGETVTYAVVAGVAQVTITDLEGIGVIEIWNSATGDYEGQFDIVNCPLVQTIDLGPVAIHGGHGHIVRWTDCDFNSHAFLVGPGGVPIIQLAGGGIARPIALAPGSAADTAGSSSRDYTAPIAAVVAGTVIALAAGGWYVRRRLRQRRISAEGGEATIGAK